MIEASSPRYLAASSAVAASVLYPLSTLLIPMGMPAPLVVPLQALTWALFSLLLLVSLKKLEIMSSGKPMAGLALAVIYIVGYITVAGLGGGLGLNPLSYEPDLFMLTTSWLLFMALGAELFRSLLFRYTERRGLVVVSTSIFFVATTIPLTVLSNGGVMAYLKAFATRSPLLGLFILGGILNSGLGLGVALGFTAGSRLMLGLLPFLPTAGIAVTILAALLGGLFAYSSSLLLMGASLWNAGSRHQLSSWKPGLAPWSILFIVLMSIGPLTGMRAVVVVSGSMEPTIRVGDLVIVTRVSPTSLTPGNVILYRKGDGLVLHRIVSIEVEDGQTIIKTKGDANNAPDPWTVSPEDVVGVAKARLPWAGWPSLIFKRVFGGLL